MDETVGGLTLRGLIGRGAHGAVWRAERRGAPGRVVAVKLIEVARPPSAGDMWSRPGERIAPLPTGSEAVAEDRSRELHRLAATLQQVATTLRALAHPNVMRIETVEVVDDRVAVVLPYAAAGSLHDVLAAPPEGGLPLADVADLGACLADALAACHAAGLRHGALGATNVVFGADGQAQLADVGLADALQRSELRHGDLSDDACREDGRDLARLLACFADDQAVVQAAELSGFLAAAAGSGPPGGSEVSPHPRCRAADLGERLASIATHLRGGGDPPQPRRVAGPSMSTPEHAPSDPQRTEPSRSTARRGQPDRVGTAGRRPREVAAHHRLRWGAIAAAVAVLAFVAATRNAADPPTVPERQESAVAPATAVATDLATDLAPGPGAPTAEVPARPGPEAQVGAASVQPVTARAAPPFCPEHTTSLPTPGAGSELQVVSLDLDARACGVPVSFDGRVLHVPDTAGEVQRLELVDVPQDAVLLAGDWDCDGRDGIALYLPSTGETLRFDRLPDAGREVRATTEPTGVPGGEASVHVDDRGCAEVVVVPS